MNIRKTFLAAGMIASLSGCYWQPEVSSTVLIMGDSIMEETSSVFVSTLSRRDNAPMVINNSMGGMTTVHDGSSEYWSGRVTAIRGQTQVDTVFVSLGANDMAAYSGEDKTLDVVSIMEEFPTGLDLIMSSMDGVEVYWLVPHIYMSGREEALTYVRQALADAEMRWDNLNLLYIDEMPEYIDEDNIHLNKDGESGVALMFIDIILQ